MEMLLIVGLNWEKRSAFIELLVAVEKLFILW